MSAFKVIPPYESYKDVDGDPLKSGYIYIGVAGVDPEVSPISVYWDRDLTIPAAQPLRTLAGYISRSGSPSNIFVNADDYSITVRNKNGSLVYTSLTNKRAIPYSSLTGVPANTIEFETFAVALAADLTSYNLIKTKSFFAAVPGVDEPIGAAAYYRDGTFGTASTAYASNLGFFDSTGAGFSIHGNSWTLGMFGIPRDGTAFAASAISNVTLALSNKGGGVLVAEDGDYLIQGAETPTVHPNVIFKCLSSASATIRSQTGGQSANHTLISMRSNTKLHHFDLEGSDYINQSGGAGYIAWNKIGITTQSGTANSVIDIYDIGFSKFINSDVFVFDNNKQVDIRFCRSPGQQVGGYAEVDGSGNVLSWNVQPDPVKLAAGTQVYCLHNFYNSGSSTGIVNIYNNRIINLNDSFAAPNLSGATDHKIYNNESVKFTAGYFGGYGADFNGCKNSVAYGNTFTGHSYGVYFHAGCINCKAWGNTGTVATGAAFESTGKGNRSFGNTWILQDFTNWASDPNQVLGAGAGVITRESSRNFCSDEVYPAAVTTAVTTKAITNVTSGTNGRVRIEVAAHGWKKRNIVEISGVVGVSCDGLWEILGVDTNNFELIGSVFSGSYTSGGNATRAIAGVASLRSSSSSSSRIRCYDMGIQDLGVAYWAYDITRVLYSIGGEITNCGQNTRGEGVYTNNLDLITGLSGSATPCRNFSGSETILASTTTTAVTFDVAESDANYKILFSNNNQDLGIYWTNKTTTGFTINHVSPGFDRICDWIIVR